MPFSLQHTTRHQAAGDVMQLGPLRPRLTAGQAELILALRVLGRSAQLDGSACEQEVTMYETLRGLEAKTQEGRWYLFSDYQRFRQLSFTAPWHMRAGFAFERQQGYCCPLNAVA
jgi:hypothetical protein